MAKTIKQIADEEYYNELKETIDIKLAQAIRLFDEIKFLRFLIRQVEAGRTKDEIKAEIEHNPFDDFDFFCTKRSR